MDGIHAYISPQGAINDCYDHLTRTLRGEGLELFQDDNLKVDHFGFVRDRRSYLSEREEFYQRVINSDNYAEEAGFVSIGRQSPTSNYDWLKWDGRPLDNLVLFGNEAWGVTTGYLGITVPNLDWPASRMREHDIGHAWTKMFGERCVFVDESVSRLPKFRLCIFESGIQQMRLKLDRIRF